MTFFSGPEYASYIALCRELRLEREFERGDWFWLPSSSAILGGGKIDLCDEERTLSYYARDEDWIWLPRLDQWLVKLEEMGWTGVFISLLAGGGYVAEGQQGMEDEAPVGRGSTREEAVLRLYCAVTGQEVKA